MTTTYTLTRADQQIIRANCLSSPSNDRVRIQRNGEVHVYGTMPNTNKDGWYFAGFADEILAVAKRT